MRVRVIFSGRVQGVFFRANAQKYALEHKVDGWARNTLNGDVEAMFEGEETDVDMVIQKCQHEQPYARVDNIQVFHEIPRRDVSGFKIKY
ncbi:MAG: acylphosphatase [Thermoplasmata archaeon]|nr:acylphosphatase [Thermoplasmata archaeon]